VAIHLWQSSFCVVVAWLLTLTLRRNRAAVRYAIWLAASVKFLVPSSLLVSAGSQLGWRTAPAASFVLDEIVAPLAAPLAAGPPAVAPPVANALPAVLWTVWGCGIAMGVVFWVRAWLRIRAAQRAAKPVALHFPVPVMSTQTRLEPGVFGILRPILLLPEGIGNRLTPPQLDAILAHELCHARLMDNLTGAIHMVVETIFWFHPLVWWIRGRLIEERERACDEAVLAQTGDPQAYAAGILRVCELYLEAPLACVSGITGSDLRKRIQRITECRAVSKLSPARKLLLTASGALLLAGPFVAGMPNAPLVQAQSPGTPRAFEVASIKPSSSAGNAKTIHVDPGMVTIRGMSLKDLTQRAYGRGHALQLSRGDLVAGGAKWCEDSLYDIDAKPGGNPLGSGEDVSGMLKTLLVDRFKLTFHHESKDTAGYLLIVDKDGPKMKERSPGDGGEPRTGTSRASPGGFHVVRRDTSMTALADYLGFYVLDRPVVDRTGLARTFDFELNWAPDENQFGGRYAGTPPDSNLPDLVKALREQIGLRLETGRAPVDVLVIDHAEKPSEN